MRKERGLVFQELRIVNSERTTNDTQIISAFDFIKTDSKIDFGWAE
jgi:hypothetical protein